jgi:hypothetical protein
MKITQVISDTNVGGAGVLLSSIVSALKDEFEFEVILPRASLLYGRFPDTVRVTYLQVAKDRSFHPKDVATFASYFRKTRPDVIHTHAALSARIAAKLSCSQSYVANKLRLLKLSPDEMEKILESGLSERHARALLRLCGEARGEALRAVIRRGLNVASTEEYVDKLLEAEKKGRERERAQRQTKLIIKDVTILYNTIDRAVETVRLSGIDVQTLRRESVKDTEIVIRIPKPEMMQRQ